jgi:SAM-dependent methyltransferase
MNGSAKYLDQPRREVHEYIPPDASHILDVGCWMGGFGASIKASRPERVVWGIEPNAEAAEVASRRLDRVIVGTFPSEAPLGQLFSAVTFIDVVEHFLDPWGAIREAGSLLAPGGVVVAAIPNIRHAEAVYPLLVRGRWDYSDSGLLDQTHLRFFTRATAVELFESSGYEVVRVAPVNMSYKAFDMGFVARMSKWCEELFAHHYVVVARPPT